MSNREKLQKLLSDKETHSLERAKNRREQRSYSRLSKNIAFNILSRLRQLGWQQKDLAAVLDVSPQLVSKWVKGKENFTLETLTKIGNVLDLNVLTGEPLRKEIPAISVTIKAKTPYNVVCSGRKVPSFKKLPANTSRYGEPEIFSKPAA